MGRPIGKQSSPRSPPQISRPWSEFLEVGVVPPMNALEILRETVRILRTNPSTFMTILALLICPVSAALLSNTLVDGAVVGAVSHRLILLAVTSGLPLTHFLKQMCHHLAIDNNVGEEGRDRLTGEKKKTNRAPGSPVDPAMVAAALEQQRSASGLGTKEGEGGGRQEGRRKENNDESREACEALRSKPSATPIAGGNWAQRSQEEGDGRNEERMGDIWRWKEKCGGAKKEGQGFSEEEKRGGVKKEGRVFGGANHMP